MHEMPPQSSLVTKVPSAPYPELPSVMGRLVADLQEVLAENLVGVYLVGSLATGDFDLDSDVDFLVVIADELTAEKVRLLQSMHARIHDIGCYPAEHLEGSYISLTKVNRPEGVGVEPLWYLDNGSTVLERSLHDNRWHVRWVLRERGINLVGPQPASLLGPVPVAAMRAEVAGMMRQMADQFAEALDGPLTYWSSRFGQSFAVLTCCRMLQTLRTGMVRSKMAGMKWALEELDPAWFTLIRDAWTEREGVRHCIKIRQPAPALALEQTLSFIRYAVCESESRFPVARD